jgi:hypothetical protein
LISAISPSSTIFYAGPRGEMSSTHHSLSRRYVAVGRPIGRLCPEYRLFTKERRSLTHDNALTEVAMRSLLSGRFCDAGCNTTRHNASGTLIAQLNAVYKCKAPSRTDARQTITTACDAFRHRPILGRCALDQPMGGYARRLPWLRGNRSFSWQLPRRSRANSHVGVRDYRRIHD